MTPLWRIFVLLPCALATGALTLCAETVFRSGPTRVALLELYTSEGCSSCPPAEEWLSARHNDAGLWKEFVPVSFHVSYWDKLGWRDPLAGQNFTQRQYTYAGSWESGSVYTPCFVLNGREWQPSAALDHGEPDAGRLTLAQTKTGVWRIEYLPPAGASGAFEISLALLGSGIVSQVRAGENEGRELHHDFAVLQMAAAPLEPEENGAVAATLTLPGRSNVTVARRAMAAWVSRRGELRPLQAVGGWIEN